MVFLVLIYFWGAGLGSQQNEAECAWISPPSTQAQPPPPGPQSTGVVHLLQMMKYTSLASGCDLASGRDWATSLSLSLSCNGEGNGNPLQFSCLENPRDGRAWGAAVYGVAQSRTQLKRLSSSSSIQTTQFIWRLTPGACSMGLDT